MNPKIDKYFIEGCMRCPLGDTPECKVNNWRDEMTMLRQFIIDCGLTEELKWSVPCYTWQKKNILILSAFKEYCALSFFKGVLLKDTESILVQQTENVQEGRQLRFTDEKEIAKMESVIKAYIHEAIAIEKAGLKVKLKKTSDFNVPKELQEKFDNDPTFKSAFNALTPGRQRGYLLHFSAPKQSATRSSRIEKCMQKIFEGKGFHDW